MRTLLLLLSIRWKTIYIQLTVHPTDVPNVIYSMLWYSAIGFSLTVPGQLITMNVLLCRDSHREMNDIITLILTDFNFHHSSISFQWNDTLIQMDGWMEYQHIFILHYFLPFHNNMTLYQYLSLVIVISSNRSNHLRRITSPSQPSTRSGRMWRRSLVLQLHIC